MPVWCPASHPVRMPTGNGRAGRCHRPNPPSVFEPAPRLCRRALPVSTGVRELAVPDRSGRLLRSAFTPPHIKVRLHRLIMQAFDCLSMVVVRKASAGRMTEWAPVARANILDHILSIGIAL